MITDKMVEATEEMLRAAYEDANSWRHLPHPPIPMRRNWDAMIAAAPEVT